MINQEYDKQICAWIEAHKETILQDWMDLVRIPSVRSEAAPKAPFGPDCAKALKKAAKNLERRGFPVKLNEDEGYALAYHGDGEKIIGLFGHSDVVPTGDGWLFTEPFNPIIKEGKLIGRGSSDNKSGVTASMCVLEALRDLNIPLRSRIQAFVGSNEESGMGDVEAFVRNEVMPDLSLVPDSSFPCALGEKGILRMWAECDTPLQMIRDIRGGDAFNIVLDKTEVLLPADAALEAQLRAAIADNAAYELTAAEGGLLLRCTGVAKHAAHPEGGINATVLACNALLTCDALPESDRHILQTVSNLITAPDGSGLGIAFMDEDFGPLTCANGMVAVIDSKLRVSLDIRYGVAMAGKELERLLHLAWEREGWQIVHMNNREGFSADKNSSIPEIMIEVCREITGQEYKPYRMAGGTYARYLKNAFAVGVTAAIPGREPSSLVMPAGRGGAHQRDECIDIDLFLQAIRVLFHAVIACDAAINQ